jgi:hypothetical protein
MADMLIPVSMALITVFDAEHLGVVEADKNTKDGGQGND